MVHGSENDRFRALYERLYRSVVAYFRRAGFSQEEVHDLTQDTFVRVFRSMETMRGGSAAAEHAFVRTTAERVGYNEIRRRRTEKRKADEVSLDALPYLPTGASESAFTGRRPRSPDREVIEREERTLRLQRIQEGIVHLPPNLRQTLLMWLAGAKYQEIADTLKITLNTVKSRIYRAKKRLEELVAEEDRGPQ